MSPEKQRGQPAVSKKIQMEDDGRFFATLRKCRWRVRRAAGTESGGFRPEVSSGTVRQAGRILLDKGGFLAVSVCDLRSESDRCPIYESDVISVTRDEFFRFFPLVSERRSPATSCDAGRIHRKKDILSVIIIDFSTAFGYSTSAVSIRQFRSFERQIGLSKKNSKKKRR